jgi:hypothetical protein
VGVAIDLVCAVGRAPRARGPAALAAAVLGALLAAALPAVASAEIYGWVDPSGTVTYSNLPPPRDAKITDVIHDTPMSPQAIAEAARRSEISALNDRIRLLELELARTQREVVEYPGPPPGPAGVGCGPDGYSDCNPQWGPYYTTGFLYGTGDRGRRDYRGEPRGRGHDNRPPRPAHHGSAPSARAVPIAASPNRSSLGPR